jgi:LEA14-like dessication related protein
MSATVVVASIVVACMVLACSPKDPTVNPRVARVLAVAPSGLSLAIDLEVHNPNSFPLMVHAVQGQIMLGNGAVLGSGIAYPGGNIPAQGARLVTAQLDVPWVNLGALAPFALSSGPVPYVFKGEAAIGGESLNIKVPFELGGNLTREQLIAAGLRGL